MARRAELVDRLPVLVHPRDSAGLHVLDKLPEGGEVGGADAALDGDDGAKVVLGGEEVGAKAREGGAPVAGDDRLAVDLVVPVLGDDLLVAALDFVAEGGDETVEGVPDEDEGLDVAGVVVGLGFAVELGGGGVGCRNDADGRWKLLAGSPATDQQGNSEEREESEDDRALC